MKRVPWAVFLKRLAAISSRTPVERMASWLDEQ
jgi:hypothetical protein